MKGPIRFTVPDGWAIKMTARSVDFALTHLRNIRINYGARWNGEINAVFHLYPRDLTIRPNYMSHSSWAPSTDMMMKRRREL